MRFSSYAGRARGPPLLVGKDTCIRSGPASRSDSFGMPHLYYLCPQGQRIIECGVKAQVWRKGMQGRVSLALVCTAQRWDSHVGTCLVRQDSSSYRSSSGYQCTRPMDQIFCQRRVSHVV